MLLQRGYLFLLLIVGSCREGGIRRSSSSCSIGEFAQLLLNIFDMEVRFGSLNLRGLAFNGFEKLVKKGLSITFECSL